MLFRLIFVFFISNFLNFGFIHSSYAADANILVFGDSLSAAYGIPREQGWVSLLQERLKTQGYPYHVVNASISGETTSGGLSRINAALKEHQPAIVLIELGANDGLRGLSIDALQNNLSKIIETSKKSKAQVILVGMRIPPNYGIRYAKEFSAAYTNLAKQYQLPLIPFLLDGIAGKPELTIEDGLHPNVTAQPQLLDNVWKTLMPVLGKATPAK
ncbi:MAG: arylesterase [Methylophilaceae bacterium]